MNLINTAFPGTRQCFSASSFLDPILIAGEAKVLRDTAEAAIEEAPIAAPARRRL